MKKIYILDDELPIIYPLSKFFERRQYLVKTFQSAFDFLGAMMTEKPSVVLLDIKLLEEDGRQLCRLVKAKYKSQLPVILMSATPALGKYFADYEADAFIEKPFDLPTVCDIVAQLAH